MSRSEETPNPPASHRLEAWTQRTRAAIRALPNVPFFLGIVLGFGGCMIAGRAVSQRLMFHDFVRFFQSIQPQHYFYPTASQLAAHVRVTVPPGKTPVLVGGASYFRGTGQNRGELWSVELQRLLGDRYVVINFAIDQAEITSFAAVIFKILAHEYPDLIYIANGNPVAGFPADGGEIYRYLFWDAYYKGLLPEAVLAGDNIRALARDQRRERNGLELHLGKWLDSHAYACDLWTWIGYDHFFTVWSDAHAHSPFRARRFDGDGDYPNYAKDQLGVRADTKYAQHSERHGREMSHAGFAAGADGQWRVDPAAWNGWAKEWREMFVAELRPRCFVVFLRGNPYFAQALTDDERQRLELQFQLGRENLERVGYRVVQLRAEDFTADDFLDGGHLMPSGGNKVAKAVAERIEEVKQAGERR